MGVEGDSPFIAFYPRFADFEGEIPVVPGARDRDWFQSGFYHCLPLQVANQLGWTVLAPADFSVCWTGGVSEESLTVRGPSKAIVSHFGNGIFSFVPPFLFRTSRGVSLLIKAVPNQPKDGVCVLEGLVETDNLRGPFTFNFRVTRPNCWIGFVKDEPIAQLVPYPRDWLQSFDVQTISEGPEYENFLAKTREFERTRGEILASGDDIQTKRDRLYLRGRHLDGSQYAEHLKAFRVKSFPRPERKSVAIAATSEPVSTSSQPPVYALKESTPFAGDREQLISPEKRFAVVPEFYPAARKLRRVWEEHFGRPHEEVLSTHQVWDYWYAPPLYRYLRTLPEKVFPEHLIAEFMRFLTRWSIRTLGLSTVVSPWLALYTNGFRQGLHNDVGNGAYAYVFSLTEWTNRKFIGGETLIFPPRAYWGSGKDLQPAAGSALYDAIPPHFNQLLVFDDHLIHGVEAVLGTYDPLDARVVMTGHLAPGPIVVDGPVDHAAVASNVGRLRPELDLVLAKKFGRLRGLVTARVDFSVDGAVADITPLLTQIDALDRVEPDISATIVAELSARLRALSVPPADGPSSLYLPIQFLAT